LLKYKDIHIFLILVEFYILSQVRSVYMLYMMSLKQTTHTNNLQGIEEKTEHGQHTRFNVVRFP